MNVREKMALIADWLGWQDEDLSAGLRSMQDAEKLYDRAMKGDWPEMAEEWKPRQLIRVIGYDPLAAAAVLNDPGY